MGIAIFNYGKSGAVPATLPEFTYTGTYTLIDEGDGNWKIKLLTSGTLTFTDKQWTTDVFLVGGGGNYPGGGGGGGGGGRTTLSSGAVFNLNVGYVAVIGAGGGGQSSINGLTANGGNGGGQYNGGAGGSGGGGRPTGVGGSNGSNGANSSEGSGGAGQGTTTREFHEATADLYARGGGGYYAAPGAGLAGANSGAGGGGISYTQAGQSGIIIVRNHRAA